MTLRDAGEVQGCKILEAVGQGDWRIWGCWWYRGEWLMQEVGGDRDWPGKPGSHCQLGQVDSS